MVGTPGRLEDLISTGKLELSSCRFFVLDECVSSVYDVFVEVCLTWQSVDEVLHRNSAYSKHVCTVEIIRTIV